MIKFRSDSFDRLSTKTIATLVTGVAVAGAGLSVALVHAEAPPQKPGTSTSDVSRGNPLPAPGEEGHTAKLPQSLDAQEKAAKKAALPGGISTGTSFWDASTASGKPMSYHTLASPYWPLGTKVKVTIGSKSAVGIVEDFGPAEWAVAQHDPPAIIDLSEEMMQYLTGTRSNSVPVKFQVLEMGKGPVYRHSGTGFDMATGISDK